MRFLKITEAWNNKVFETFPNHNVKQMNKILESTKLIVKKKHSSFILIKKIKVIKKFVELAKKKRFAVLYNAHTTLRLDWITFLVLKQSVYGIGKINIQ